jgi:toxin ParE1/3/4
LNCLIISPRAIADLDDICDYIAIDNPNAALRTMERLQELSRFLRDHPGLGTVRDDIAKGVRSSPEGNCLILFRKYSDGVEIVRDVHGARRSQGLI